MKYPTIEYKINGFTYRVPDYSKPVVKEAVKKEVNEAEDFAISMQGRYYKW